MLTRTLFMLALLMAAAGAGAIGLELPLPRPAQPAELPPAHFAPQGEGPATNQRSAKDAAREAQQQNGGGRVLSVDAATGGWRVKLLKDGNVRMVFVPD